MSVIIKSERKILMIKNKLKGFMATKPALQTIMEGILLPEDKQTNSRDYRRKNLVMLQHSLNKGILRKCQTLQKPSRWQGAMQFLIIALNINGLNSFNSPSKYTE